MYGLYAHRELPRRFLASSEPHEQQLHRHLSDPSDRGTYESAHSVVLSIFASHAQHHPFHAHVLSKPDATNFVHQMVPFYAQCLIEVC
jgi:hypothetical protein